MVEADVRDIHAATREGGCWEVVKVVGGFNSVALEIRQPSLAPPREPR